jgi:transcriptional regulator with XRE-family HTH domain
MGRQAGPRPQCLAEKLAHIRAALGLSQNEMIKRMGLAEELVREEISDFERGKRVPPLGVLLEYARAAGVYLDALVDDDLTLPAKLPCSPKHGGLRRRQATKKNRSV